ncbi:hypothetical protein [Rathayibacter tritici]|uniref:Hemagglutinin n=1 Tax=Rathayibacter tritici TaxID=33888 RepID=A0A160KTW0_9MICO|nr:hypothetical protein [Rathayibacter tritici]AND16944.1 hypothetical protein A6122_1815 [Rathayibacter tritici]
MLSTAPPPTGARRRRGGAVVVVPVLAALVLGGSVDDILTADSRGPQTVRLWTFLQPGPVAADFDPGDLVSDEVFFDGDALGPLTVQAFLNARVPECEGSEIPCLRDYAEDTAAIEGDEQCAAVPAGRDRPAAEIISAVAGACTVNPAVLLVLLQKEQSLVTDPEPSERQFRSATGYGCPDTADCDTDSYGFAAQVYGAAWQFQRYRNPDSSFDRYPVGATSDIRYSPDEACGAAAVTVVNAATAGLYSYTPYQPNAAVLENLYGEGDDCSAYGNRNFWRIFSTWFGDPRG